MNKYCCKACDRLVISTAVTFAAGVLTIDLPAGAYNDCQKYCILIGQEIPTTATRGAPVVFTIGGGEVTYPFVDCCGTQLTQEEISYRYRYMTRVQTNATGGVFKWLGKGACSPVARLTSIDGTVPAAGGVGA